jgi:hypothetical protein
MLDGKSGEEDRNQAILAERDTEVGITRDLKKETAVSPFIKELLFRKAPGGQTA